MHRMTEETNSAFIRRMYFASLFPNIIAVLGGTVNVFFDGILVGQKLGETGLAGVNQALPVYLILCTIGSLFASGASVLSSMAFGANDREEGQRIFRATLTVSAAAGLVFCGLGLAFLGPITSLLSSPETYDYVRTYVAVTLAGGVFKILLYVPFCYLRLEGKNSRSATAMLTMTGLNILLDYVFLFLADWGIAGAAWASVIATAVACVMSFYFLFTDHPNFLPGIAFYRGKDLVDVARYGSAMALNNVLSSARILVLNTIFKSMPVAGMVAVFAVVNNINEFSICVQNGVPQTGSAMTGIFFGEKDSSSVKELVKTELTAGAVLSAALGVILALFSGRLGRLFGSTSDCSIAVVCFAASLLFATANSVLTYFYNATGRVGMANVITVCRGFVMVAGFCFLFSALGNGVWLFYPAAETATLLLVLAIGLVLAKRKDLSPVFLLDESFERSGHCISFVTDCSSERICGASEGITDFCQENGFPPKKVMAISLAIEEMLTIIAQKSLNGEGTMDVRLIKSGGEGILRIRSGGQRYNPIEEMSDDLDYMGVQMISKMARKVEYFSSLGINTLIIFL